MAFAFALVGLIRAQEARQDGNALQMALYDLLGLVGLSAFGAGIVLGLIAMAQK